MTVKAQVFPAPYCGVSFQYNADGNMVTRVQFAGIDNTSPFTSGTTPSMEDFLSISGTVTQNQSYPIQVKGPSSTFPSDVMVYIDWNQNQSFADAGEAYYIGRLASANPANAFTISDTITVPANALPGATRMRILKNTNVAAYSDPNAANSITDACSATLRSGQLEDYTLNVLAGGPQPCTPAVAGPNTGDLGCVTFSYLGQTVYYTTVRAADGNVWLQQNLGSAGVAASKTDSTAYGDLFQWGRWDDGHQLRNSATGAAPAQNDPSGLGNGNPVFITGSGSLSWWNGTKQLTDTWAGQTPADATTTNGVDPCKVIGSNWSLPTQPEWAALVTAEQMTDPDAAYNSNLKLTVGGSRSSSSGNFDFVGVRGYYWSNTTSSTGGKYFYYSSVIMNPNAGNLRGGGAAVRCVQVIPVIVLIDSIDVRIQNNAAPQITTDGGTLQAEALVYPSTANQNVTWSIVPGTGMATIDANGLVSAVDNGTVWARAVSVTDTTKKDSVLITISGQVTPVLSVTVSTQNNVPALINTPNGTLQLLAVVNPVVVNQSVNWSVILVTGAATVSATGLVTAQVNGTVWAKAVSADDPTKSDSILITISGQVTPVLSVQVSTQNNVPATISVQGGTLQLIAEVQPLAADQAVSWTVVPQTGAATISATGLLTAQSDGTVWARATSVQDPSKADSILVTISNQQGTTGLEDNSTAALSVFPNPADAWVQLRVNGDGLIRGAELISAGGSTVRSVANIQATSYMLDLSALPAGVYVLKVYTKTGAEFHKLIKK
ncbi:MAG: Ig-like domain-containing protein [Bacteroidia bacterium]|nr:Ig-like domain-containing protein [Bacteroidia bacterium]